MAAPASSCSPRMHTATAGSTPKINPFHWPVHHGPPATRTPPLGECCSNTTAAGSPSKGVSPCSGNLPCPSAQRCTTTPDPQPPSWLPSSAYPPPPGTHLCFLHERGDVRLQLLRSQRLCRKPELLRPHLLVHIVHHPRTKGGDVEVVHLAGVSPRIV